MKRYFYITLTVLLSQACQLMQNTNTLVYTIDAEEAIDAQAENISLKSISKSIDFIPLETSQASLIGNIKDVILCKDYILVIHSKKCSMYDKNGKFISDIGRRGKGRNEYLNIDNIFVKSDTIYLYDSYTNIIHKHSPENQHISKFKILPTLSDFRGISIIGEDEFVVFTPDKGLPRTKHSLTFFNHLGVIKDSIPRVSKLPAPSDINWYYNEASFVESKEGLIYKDIFNDTIFLIDRKSEKEMSKYLTSPKYIFNLGKYKAVEDARYHVKQSFQSAKVYSPYSEMAKIELLGETDTYLFFCAADKKEYFYDKSLNKLNKWTLTIPEYEEQSIEDPSSFTPLKIDSNGNLIGFVNAIDEEDNPILVIADLEK